MSIFSETKLKLGENEQCYSTSISNLSEFPVAAVAIPNGVIFFDENGERMEFKLSKYETC